MTAATTKAPTEKKVVRPADNIYEKLAAIQAEAPRLKKEGEMDLGGSKKLSFLQIDSILDHLRPLFVKYDVLMVPTLIKAKSHIKYGDLPPKEVKPETWSGKIPTKSIREKVIYDFTFIDVEHPESQLTVRASGEAMDTQDKATGKAFTACYKNALIKTFMLITGDPEIEDVNTDAEPAAEKKDRGTQQREAAKPTSNGTTTPPKRTATTNPRPAAKAAAQEASEVAHGAKEPPLEVTPQQQNLIDAKARLVAANLAYGEATGVVKDDGKTPGPGLSPIQVNEIALDLLRKTRDKWITLPTDIKKIAAHIEKMAEDVHKAAAVDPEAGATDETED